MVSFLLGSRTSFSDRLFLISQMQRLISHLEGFSVTLTFKEIVCSKLKSLTLFVHVVMCSSFLKIHGGKETVAREMGAAFT